MWLHANTTFLFLSGNHTLDGSLYLFSSMGIRILCLRPMKPEMNSSITFNQDVGFVFNNLKFVEIVFFEIMSCSSDIDFAAFVVHDVFIMRV